MSRLSVRPISASQATTSGCELQGIFKEIQLSPTRFSSDTGMNLYSIINGEEENTRSGENP